MATRFYLPATGTAPLASLAVDSNWEHSDGLERRPCAIEKSNTSLTGQQYTWPDTTTDQAAIKQFQSKRLAAGYSWTTSDTVSMVMKCVEAAAQVDTHLAYVVRVVSGDGSTIRGVIGLYHATSTEFPTTAATRIHSARTNGASNFSSQAGDRIIIEIGGHGVSPTTNNFTITFGDPSATDDYALTADLLTDLCPWVELSRDISFVLTTSCHAYIKGIALATPGVQSAYMQGSNPSYPASTSTAVYIKGGVVPTPAQQSAYIDGGVLVDTQQSAYISGGIPASTGTSVYLHGGAEVSVQQPSYMRGNAVSSGSQSAYMQGYMDAIPVDTYLHAFIKGGDYIPLIPDVDIARSGAWQDELARTNNIYQSIDEESLPDDNDFIENISHQNGEYYECGLTDPIGPISGGTITMKIRARNNTSGSYAVRMQLRQGSTVIASRDQVLPTDPTTYGFDLTVGERANITDPTDLRLRFIVLR